VTRTIKLRSFLAGLVVTFGFALVFARVALPPTSRVDFREVGTARVDLKRVFQDAALERARGATEDLLWQHLVPVPSGLIESWENLAIADALLGRFPTSTRALDAESIREASVRREREIADALGAIKGRVDPEESTVTLDSLQP
jgi:hypothetical protein